VALFNDFSLCIIKHIANLLQSNADRSFLLIHKLQQAIKQSNNQETMTYPLFTHAFLAYGDDLIRYIQVVFAPEKQFKIIEEDKEFNTKTEFM
jgi:hypothetical protein